jgi:hypothetical protein
MAAKKNTEGVAELVKALTEGYSTAKSSKRAGMLFIQAEGRTLAAVTPKEKWATFEGSRLTAPRSRKLTTKAEVASARKELARIAAENAAKRKPKAAKGKAPSDKADPRSGGKSVTALTKARIAAIKDGKDAPRRARTRDHAKATPVS